MYLIKPKSYKMASDADKRRICNGTGAAGSPRWLVSLLDNLFGFGLDVSAASNIHDWMYHIYSSMISGVKLKVLYIILMIILKTVADLVFFVNIVILAIVAIFIKPFSNMLGSFLLFIPRLARAFIYFLAVFLFGWRPFSKS